MKNLLKFSVKWEHLGERLLLLRLVSVDSIGSKLKPEDETLEAFAEGIETLGFLLKNQDAELHRGDVVTLEFVGNDLKYFYIQGKKFQLINHNELRVFVLKPVPQLEGLETLPELFQHRIKYLAEYAGEDFVKWDLQQEIQGCALAVAVYEKLLNGTSLLTEADFAGISSLLGEDYKFVGGCPINFALAMCFALQVCPEDLLRKSGKELLPELVKWPVMYLPVCGDTARNHYQPNRNDIVSYVKTQNY